MKSPDSTIEEGIASIPGLSWFDSRKSGDVVGYAHKCLWVILFGLVAKLIGFPAWYGGALYGAIYAAAFKIPVTLKHRKRWLEHQGNVDQGPWGDRRPSPPWHTGYYTDAILDLSTVAAVTLLAWRLG